MGPYIILTAWAAALVLGLSPIPRWLPWLIPLALAVYFTVAYTQELNPESGDGQPGLITAVGIVATAVCLGLTVLGASLRSRTRVTEKR